VRLRSARAKLPKPSKRLLEVLSRDEIQALEDVAVTERDRLIVRIPGDTGIRGGELVNLTTHDLINRDRNLYLRVGGKTGERLVPIPRLSLSTAEVRRPWTAARRGE
jgi:integrase